MPRGRQYYDPIIQVPSKVEVAEDLSRIELYLSGDARDATPNAKWVGRRIGPDGLIAEVAEGDFNYQGALEQAQALWPGLTVYQLAEESEDSTWDGMGPSPRLWQNPVVEVSPAEARIAVARIAALVANAYEPYEDLSPLPEVEDIQVQIRGITVEAGTYLFVDDVRTLLRSYAEQYDQDGNPSAALGLRTAAEMLGS